MVRWRIGLYLKLTFKTLVTSDISDFVNIHVTCVVCAPSDDYVTGCLLTRGGSKNVGYAPDG